MTTGVTTSKVITASANSTDSTTTDSKTAAAATTAATAADQKTETLPELIAKLAALDAGLKKAVINEHGTMFKKSMKTCVEYDAEIAATKAKIKALYREMIHTMWDLELGQTLFPAQQLTLWQSVAKPLSDQKATLEREWRDHMCRNPDEKLKIFDQVLNLFLELSKPNVISSMKAQNAIDVRVEWLKQLEWLDATGRESILSLTKPDKSELFKLAMEGEQRRLLLDSMDKNQMIAYAREKKPNELPVIIRLEIVGEIIKELQTELTATQTAAAATNSVKPAVLPVGATNNVPVKAITLGLPTPTGNTTIAAAPQPPTANPNAANVNSLVNK